MNSDLTGGKRRARHTPEQVALEQAVMRAQAERLSLHPEGLRGLEVDCVECVEKST